MKKLKELLLPIYLILNIFCILIGSYKYTLSIYKNYKRISKLYIILLILNVIVILISFMIKNKKEKTKIKYKLFIFIINNYF